MSSVYHSKASVYQQIFKKIYNQTYGKQKSKWEYFVLGLRVYQWLSDHDPNYTNNLLYDKILEAIDEIFDIILSLLEMMKAPPSLLSSVVYYANKFVSRTGIKHNQLFNLLLTSTIVTLKFWSESTPINNRILADIFEFPVQDINLMERRFLTGIDYHLIITEEQIEIFLSKIDITSTLKQSLPTPSATNYKNINMKQQVTPPVSPTTSAVVSNSAQSQHPGRLTSSKRAPSNSNLKCMEPQPNVGYVNPPSTAYANC
ncbi:hypothetical protein PPL_06075 [Heterostelium album PN500]|uniref:Cyclin N-terminal domain-containing protein n=1 Tax=Heterostelium pallidum (strain ATCC 26659 / Pp 5 / PN500) TaxID=670386 RepID=D3BC53_HETP5|nr:hypothetical protein PPL_06075 [Heterostelium album PN500]EFA81236.1 hypothetical protein PPL_06075 [Heterostelium album PN500]|eukprot:XP_020433354.1 hypothetical protein PPL_06075 [Heterostelium album PN500]